MVKTCNRCPAHSWLFGGVPNCKLGYIVHSYARPEACKKKPRSTKEMLELKRR